MDKMMFIRDLAPVFALVGLAAIAGWVITTWLRVKHGYPLDGAWGQEIKPAISTETTERLRMLATENAQLRAETGSLKDRVAVLERIATDRSAQLERQIEDLRGEKIN
jgi:hypothetical protein